MLLSEELVRELKHAVEVRHLHGARSPTSLEWWYFTGHLWKNDGRDACPSESELRRRSPDFGVQSTFFLSDADKTKGLLAHSAQSDLNRKKHDHSELVAPLMNQQSWSPLVLIEKYFLNVALGHWRLTQLGAEQAHLDWDLRFDVKGTEYLLRLEIPKNKIWFHGQNGYLQKTTSAGNFYYSVPFVRVRGVRTERPSSGGASSTSVCGQLWFDHEIHVKQVLDVGWNWFGLSFSNQQALMFYEILTNKTATTPRGEIWDQKTARYAPLTEVKMSASDSACLRSGRCYPQSFTFTFRNPLTGKTERVATRSAFAEQELDSGTGGLARVYWEGSTTAKWENVGTHAQHPRHISDGLGYTELVPLLEKK